MKNYLTKLYDYLPEDTGLPRPTLPPPFQSPVTRPSPFKPGGYQGTIQGVNVTPFDSSRYGRGNPYGSEAIPPGEDPRDPNPIHPRPTPHPQDNADETPKIPRPIARARWNPDAANFGDLQPYWQQAKQMWGEGFAKEMGGYPQSAVSDLLSILKMNEDSMRTTGKPALVQVDGVTMGYADAIKAVVGKMRDIAKQVDQNYIATKNAVADKAKFDADQLNKIPLMPRISPIIFQ